MRSSSASARSSSRRRTSAWRERLVAELAEHRPAPQRERVAQRRGRLGRPAGGAQRAPVLVAAGEALRVQLPRLDREPVAARLGLQPPGERAEVAPHARDVRLQRVGGVRGGLLAPQRLDQRVGGRPRRGAQQQRRDQRPAARAAELERLAVVADLQRPEDEEFDRHGVSRKRIRRTSAPEAAALSGGGFGEEGGRVSMAELAAAPLTKPHLQPADTSLSSARGRPPRRGCGCARRPATVASLAAVVGR